MDPISILELNVISSLLIHRSSCPFMIDYILSSLCRFSFANEIFSAFSTVYFLIKKNLKIHHRGLESESLINIANSKKQLRHFENYYFTYTIFLEKREFLAESAETNGLT